MAVVVVGTAGAEALPLWSTGRVRAATSRVSRQEADAGERYRIARGIPRIGGIGRGDLRCDLDTGHEDHQHIGFEYP